MTDNNAYVVVIGSMMYVYAGIGVAAGAFLDTREKWTTFSCFVGAALWPIIGFLLICRYLKTDFVRDFRKSFGGEERK